MLLLGPIGTRHPGMIGDDQPIRDPGILRGRRAQGWQRGPPDGEEAGALHRRAPAGIPRARRLGPVLTEDVGVPIAAVPEHAGRRSGPSPQPRHLIADVRAWQRATCMTSHCRARRHSRRG